MKGYKIVSIHNLLLPSQHTTLWKPKHIFNKNSLTWLLSLSFINKKISDLLNCITYSLLSSLYFPFLEFLIILRTVLYHWYAWWLILLNYFFPFLFTGFRSPFSSVATPYVISNQLHLPNLFWWVVSKRIIIVSPEIKIQFLFPWFCYINFWNLGDYR